MGTTTGTRKEGIPGLMSALSVASGGTSPGPTTSTPSLSAIVSSHKLVRKKLPPGRQDSTLAMLPAASLGAVTKKRILALTSLEMRSESSESSSSRKSPVIPESGTSTTTTAVTTTTTATTTTTTTAAIGYTSTTTTTTVTAASPVPPLTSQSSMEAPEETTGINWVSVNVTKSGLTTTPKIDSLVKEVQDWFLTTVNDLPGVENASKSYQVLSRPSSLSNLMEREEDLIE